MSLPSLLEDHGLVREGTRYIARGQLISVFRKPALTKADRPATTDRRDGRDIPAAVIESMTATSSPLT